MIVDDDFHPVPRAIAALMGLATGVWLIWCTVIAFVGGKFPLLPLETDGGVGMGLIWLFLIDPIAATVAYWAALLIVMPFAIIFRSRG